MDLWRETVQNGESICEDNGEDKVDKNGMVIRWGRGITGRVIRKISTGG